MLKFLAAPLSLAVVSLVGCAESVDLAEGGGETESLQSTKASTEAEANRTLDRIETKLNRCELLPGDDKTKLRALQGGIDWTFEAYVSFKCSVEEGKIVVGEASMETRAGWSSSDGSFTEQSYDAKATVKVPLRAVSVSASTSTSVTIRQAGLRVVHDRAAVVAVGVSKDLGIVEGTAEVAFDGSKVSIQGGVAMPIPIKTTDCTGKESIGFTLKLDAKATETVSKSVTARAGKLALQNAENVSYYTAAGYFQGPSSQVAAVAKSACCDGQGTCD